MRTPRSETGRGYRSRRSSRAFARASAARFASSTPRRYTVALMKRRLLLLLQRLGLIGPSFRAYEWLVALKPGRVVPVAGPPLPPRPLMVRVAGTADPDWFLRAGRAGYDAIAAAVPLAEIASVLDFGCGCGRVTRYWHDFPGAVAGSDLDARAIAWCRENLSFARFEQNGLAAAARLRRRELRPRLRALGLHASDRRAPARLAGRAAPRPAPGRLPARDDARQLVPAAAHRRRAGALRGGASSSSAGARSPARTSAPPTTRSATCARRSPRASRSCELEPEGARGNPTQDLVLLRRDDR